jgi:hypothetical protein
MEQDNLIDYENIGDYLDIDNSEEIVDMEFEDLDEPIQSQEL